MLYQASDPNAAAAFLQQRLEQNESRIYIAWSDELNKSLGFVQLYPSFSSVSMQRLWILNDLFVHPDHRNKGVAKALMNQARDMAIQTGAKGLVLETGKENRPAQQLYEQLGYQKEADYFVYSLTL